VAYTTNCSNADYFYDFFIPFSTITTYFPSVTTSTPLRMVAEDVKNKKTAIQGQSLDVAGSTDPVTSQTTEWNTVVTNFTPTSAGNINTGIVDYRSTTPTLSSPITNGATSISGACAEADGTKIYIYKNNSLIDSTTVSGGAIIFININFSAIGLC